MSNADSEPPGDKYLAELVHGSDLNVPIDTETVGQWTHTNAGEEYRELTIQPLYVHPLGQGTAGLIGRQARDGRVVYGVRVNLDAELSSEEVDLLRAALRDLVENAESNNAQLP